MKGESLIYCKDSDYLFRVPKLGDYHYAALCEGSVWEFFDCWYDHGALHRPGEYSLDVFVLPMEFLT